MTTVYHSPITNGQAANAARINAPLAALDSAIGTAMAASLLARDSILTAGTAATLANGAANAGQKVVTVDDASVFVAGATVEYALVGGVIETNTVATVDSATQITLSTNIGTGGIPDNGLLAVVPPAYVNMRAGVFNVLDYGATGDGVTDDTTAIQAALTAGVNAVVYFPAGTYITSDTLTIAGAGQIVGGGMGASIIQAKSTHTGRGFRSDNVGGFRIADLTIDMNAAATTDGGSYLDQQAIYIVHNDGSGDLADIVLERVECKNGQARLIAVVNLTADDLNITVRDCYLHDCEEIGLALSYTTRADVRGNRIINVGTGGAFEGINISGTSDNPATHSTVIGNTIDTVGWEGIAFTHAIGIIVSDNYIRNTSTLERGWGIAISLGCADFTVSNNNVTAGDGGIAVDVAVNIPETLFYDVRGAVTGNVCAGNVGHGGSITGNHGIYTLASRGLVITGNNCHGNTGGSGISVNGSQNCVVVGNTCMDNYYGITMFGAETDAGGHQIIGNSVLGNTVHQYYDEGDVPSNILMPDVIWGWQSDTTEQLGFFGAVRAAKATGGAATAGGTWTATEVSMLQKAYDALRAFGLLT